MKTCSVEGCEGKHSAKGMCLVHYGRRQYEKNRERIISRATAWNRKNKDKRRAITKRYDDANKEARAQWYPGWYEKNKVRLIAQQVRRHKKRMREDIEFKVREYLRNRFRCALRRYRAGSKVVSAVRNLGCTMPELIRRLESQWIPGMSWGNYGCGLGQWSVDHIKPLASFDLSDLAQVERAVHYTNLQPLWHIDNMKKGDKV